MLPRRFCGVVALAVVFALTGNVPGQEKEKKVASSDYFPLKVGTTWVYEANGKSIQVKVAKHEKSGDVMCALLETSVDDTVVASEHVAVQKDGIYRYSMAGTEVKPALRFMKLPYKKGDTWKAASKVGEQEVKVEYEFKEGEIEVAAGKYKTVITETTKAEAGGQEFSAKIWYAKGVGMVKTKMKIAGMDIEIELKKFTAGK